MSRKLLLLLILLLSFPNLMSLSAQGVKSGDDSELQAMKSDVQRMRAILNQLRTNLAFVDTSQSPLKHQFQLEADMWQITLDQMDRRIAAAEQKK